MLYLIIYVTIFIMLHPSTIYDHRILSLSCMDYSCIALNLAYDIVLMLSVWMRVGDLLWGCNQFWCDLLCINWLLFLDGSILIFKEKEKYKENACGNGCAIFEFCVEKEGTQIDIVLEAIDNYKIIIDYQGYYKSTKTMYKYRNLQLHYPLLPIYLWSYSSQHTLGCSLLSGRPCSTPSHVPILFYHRNTTVYSDCHIDQFGHFCWLLRIDVFCVYRQVCGIGAVPSR